MSPRRQTPLTHEYILLGYLYHTPMHGYDLYKALQGSGSTPLIWSLKQSHLYALLDKMEKEGLLEMNVIPGETRPDRQQYHLSPAGQECFLSWVSSPVEHPRDMRQDFLGRLYFARRLGGDTALRLINQQNQRCQEWQNGMCAQEAAFDEGQDYERLVFRFRILQVQGMLDWLDECRRALAPAEDTP
ncbi:MAG: PadR family transcriptional regulator [Chloroflexi bacterium]|nr:PadR family transcriptional regulator [Chloroflexota bacterium]